MNKQVARVFRVDKPIVAMIHLYGFMPERVRGLAKWEIQQLYASGVDAVLVEDYYGTVEDVEWTLDYLRREYSDRVYGVNLLRDPEKGLKLASRYGAAFVQIDSVCGHLPQDAGRGGKDKTTLNAAENDAETESENADGAAAIDASEPTFPKGGGEGAEGAFGTAAASPDAGSVPPFEDEINLDDILDILNKPKRQ